MNRNALMRENAQRVLAGANASVPLIGGAPPELLEAQAKIQELSTRLHGVRIQLTESREANQHLRSQIVNASDALLDVLDKAPGGTLELSAERRTAVRTRRLRCAEGTNGTLRFDTVEAPATKG